MATALKLIDISNSMVIYCILENMDRYNTQLENMMQPKKDMIRKIIQLVLYTSAMYIMAAGSIMAEEADPVQLQFEEAMDDRESGKVYDAIKIFENILALREEGRTVVYTTHYREEAQKLCDRVGIIDHGRLLALDSVQRLISAHGGKSVVLAERPAGEEIRVETDQPIEELARLYEQDRHARLRLESPDLEAVFLNLTGRHLRD